MAPLPHCQKSGLLSRSAANRQDTLGCLINDQAKTSVTDDEDHSRPKGMERAVIVPAKKLWIESKRLIQLSFSKASKGTRSTIKVGNLNSALPGRSWAWPYDNRFASRLDSVDPYHQLTKPGPTYLATPVDRSDALSTRCRFQSVAYTTRNVTGSTSATSDNTILLPEVLCAAQSCSHRSG